MIPALQVRDVVVRFGRTMGLDGVSLTVPAGSTFGIVGESGSGKTTLMRAVLGLQPVASGEIRLFGTALGRGEASLRLRSRTVQAVLQDPAASLSPRQRIGRMVDEIATLQREPRDATRARAEALFTRLGLPSVTLDKYPHQISGGQARRVAVIRTLLMQPKVVFADEPTAGLDVSVQGELLNLLCDLKADFGLTLIVISHNLAAVRAIADQAAVMHRGQVVEQGPSAQVFDAPQSAYMQGLIAAWPRLARGTGDQRANQLPNS
ncbi:MAG: ABC transporter ATP-binding protein [Paracoccaceae bacterium]